MPSRRPTKKKQSEGAPKMSDGVTRALETFQGVENQILRRFLLLMPWFILIIVVVNLQTYGFTDIPAGVIMWTTGMVAAALSLFALNVLMDRIRETLVALWSRKIIVDKPTMFFVDVDMTWEDINTTNDSSISIQLEKKYVKYINDLERSMNHPGQWVTGLLFSLLVFTWWIIRDIHIGQLILELFIAIIIGLMAWRMVIVSIKIWQLGTEFCLEPQLGHADKCGGLAPLGNLCLWNALIVTIPAIYLGGWIILGSILDSYHLYDQYYYQAKIYAPIFSKLLLILVPFAVIGFFLPLWSVHQIMLAWRAGVKRQLDHLSHYIHHLDHDILNRSDMLEPQEVDKMVKKLELMEQIYQQNRHTPVWPFNIKILVKFMTSQIVPALGFILSLRS
ncbi:MAG: hypothetical protein K8R13_04755 [Methanococcoides sp.]|nr:hypothetical protein [Methanococcoides sp.]